MTTASTLVNPMLPSPLLRDHYGRVVSAHLASVKPALQEIVLDGLGDLALALAQRPLRLWQGSRDALARLLGERWAWPEATAIIDLGQQTGLLVASTREVGVLRPRDVGLFTWLGARRIARTQDQDGLMDRRLNGGLYDMFAMAPALLTDPDGAAGVVQLMADSPGPFEELLELGTAMAAAAVAWGAEASPQLRVFVTERALSWTQPMGADWNREIGTAVLVLECQRDDDREHLLNLASEVLSELVTSALSDEDLAGDPAIHATLETQLAMLLAGTAPGLGSAPGAALRPPSPERIEQVARLLPVGHAHRVARALARVMPPTPERNGIILAAAERALALGDPQGASALDALVPPYDVALPLALALVDRALEAPRDPHASRAAFGLCQAVRAWESCPPPLLERLIGLLDTGNAADVRIVAGAALGRHGQRASDDPAATPPFIHALERAFSAEDGAPPEVLVGPVGALLHLGSREARLGPAALALAASDAPPRLLQLLAAAFDVGIRRVPRHVEALVELFMAFSDRPELGGALLLLCSAVNGTIQVEHELGAFADDEPLAPAARNALVHVLLPLAGNREDALRAAEAATVCAGLLRGEAEFAQTLAQLRAYADEPSVKSLYDLALGACRVFLPAVVDRLARDAAQADAEVAAAACVALRLLVETFEQADRLEPWLMDMRLRLETHGPHQVPMQQLLAQLATLPLRA